MERRCTMVSRKGWADILVIVDVKRVVVIGNGDTEDLLIARADLLIESGDTNDRGWKGSFMCFEMALRTWNILGIEYGFAVAYEWGVSGQI